MKRTFYNHNGLIFNDLRGFIGGGGGKNDQSIMWCKCLISEKKFEKRKKEKTKIFEKTILRLFLGVIFVLVGN